MTPTDLAALGASAAPPTASAPPGAGPSRTDPSAHGPPGTVVSANGASKRSGGKQATGSEATSFAEAVAAAMAPVQAEAPTGTEPAAWLLALEGVAAAAADTGTGAGVGTTGVDAVGIEPAESGEMGLDRIAEALINMNVALGTGAGSPVAVASARSQAVLAGGEAAGGKPGTTGTPAGVAVAADVAVLAAAAATSPPAAEQAAAAVGSAPTAAPVAGPAAALETPSGATDAAEAPGIAPTSPAPDQASGQAGGDASPQRGDQPVVSSSERAVSEQQSIPGSAADGDARAIAPAEPSVPAPAAADSGAPAGSLPAGGTAVGTASGMASSPVTVTGTASAAPADSGEAVPIASGPDFTAAVAETVRGAALRGQNGVHLRLDPADLGSVQVRITETAGGLHVAFEAATREAQDLIQRHLPALRTAMEGRELRVERFEVQHAERGAEGQATGGRDATRDGAAGQHAGGQGGDGDGGDGALNWSPLASIDAATETGAAGPGSDAAGAPDIVATAVAGVDVLA